MEYKPNSGFRKYKKNCTHLERKKEKRQKYCKQTYHRFSDLNRIQFNNQNRVPNDKLMNLTKKGIFANGITSNTMTFNHAINDINDINDNHINNQLSQPFICDPFHTNDSLFCEQYIDYKPIETQDKYNYCPNYDAFTAQTYHHFENQLNGIQMNEMSGNHLTDKNEDNFMCNVFNNIKDNDTRSHSTISAFELKLLDHSIHSLSQSFRSDQEFEHNSVESNHLLLNLEKNSDKNSVLYAFNDSNEQKYIFEPTNELKDEFWSTHALVVEKAMNNYANERKEFAKRMPEFKSDIINDLCLRLRSTIIKNNSPLSREWIENIIQLRQEMYQ